MGQYEARQMNAENLNTILDNEAGNLTEREVANLYGHFNEVIKMLLDQRNGRIHGCVEITTSQKIDLITQYKNIGYYNGKVILFHIGDDQKPYVLFEHNNSKFKQIVTVLEMQRNDITLNDKDGYERIHDNSEFIITVVTPLPTSLYFYAYWVLDATPVSRNAVDMLK